MALSETVVPQDGNGGISMNLWEHDDSKVDYGTYGTWDGKNDESIPLGLHPFKDKAILKSQPPPTLWWFCPRGGIGGARYSS